MNAWLSSRRALGTVAFITGVSALGTVAFITGSFWAQSLRHCSLFVGAKALDTVA